MFTLQEEQRELAGRVRRAASQAWVDEQRMPLVWLTLRLAATPMPQELALRATDGQAGGALPGQQASGVTDA